MEKRENSHRVKLTAIACFILAILLCASPCAALEVPLPSGETTLNVDYTITDSVMVNFGGTLNLLDGSVINGTVGIWAGGTLNINGGYVSEDVYVAGGSEVNIRGGSIGGNMYWDIAVEEEAKVTVFGTDFIIENGTIDLSGTFFTPDIWSPCLLTGMYGGDVGPFDLVFYGLSSTAVHIFLAAPATEVIPEVIIDIKPGDDHNCINLDSKGLVPVAVLTTDDFDAATVDPATVEFAGAKPVCWKLKDVDDDGYDDMIFHFRTQDLNLDQESTEATLTGQTTQGVLIEGSDEVQIVSSCKKCLIKKFSGHIHRPVWWKCRRPVIPPVKGCKRNAYKR